MPYIASTLTNSNRYTLYSKPKDAGVLPQVVGEVLVEGGAGVANSKSLITPQGVITEVSAEQLDLLEQNDIFKLHKENGYIQILDKKPPEVETVVADMQRGDGSSPLTESSFDNDGVKVKDSNNSKRR